MNEGLRTFCTGNLLPAEAHMNVHVSYKTGKTPEVEHEFHHQLQRLQRRLQVFKPDLVHFHAIVEQENNHSAGASLNLRLPSGQLAAQGSGENALAAVKSAFADLLSQLTKHKELLRGHWTRKSMRREGRERLTQMPAPAGPLSAGHAGTTGGTTEANRRGEPRQRRSSPLPGPMGPLSPTWRCG